MAFTEWMIRGPQISSCNCAYGCPCQFNALPTEGNCRAAVGMHIEKGHHGKVKLDGLNFAATAAWPGAIHMGHGEIQPIVDERATPEQREALLKIMSGQDTEPGATFLQVYVSMCEKIHPPMFKKIEFEADMNSCVGRFNVPGVVETKTDAIHNPVTGKPHHAKVSLRSGFEYIDAEFASGSIKSKAPIALDTSGKHAHLCMVHINGQGIVH
jgi:hypothetical protein